MRVVAGEARGRRLLVPDTTDVRPTSDRVREAMFNSLFSFGVVDGARVLDLFAGTGALGIEALSRGAAEVVFVERNREALVALRANLDNTGLGERSAVHEGEAMVTLGRLERLDGRPFDLVLLDPPYDFAEWPSLLDLLEPTSDVVVIESNRKIEPGSEWDVLRTKQYGSTVLSIVRGRNRGRDDGID